MRDPRNKVDLCNASYTHYAYYKTLTMVVKHKRRQNQKKVISENWGLRATNKITDHKKN